MINLFKIYHIHLEHRCTGIKLLEQFNKNLINDFNKRNFNNNNINDILSLMMKIKKKMMQINL